MTQPDPSAPRPVPPPRTSAGTSQVTPPVSSPVTSPWREHGALSRGVFAVAVLVSLAVLFAPPSDVPSSPPGVDKLVHFSLFLLLALAGRWAGVRRTTLAVVLVGYAAVSEVVQGMPVVGRAASVLDWCADVLGVVAGLGLWAALTRSRWPADR
jgi:VanZ family protein